MGSLCRMVFVPVIKLIQVAIAVLEFILVEICQLIQVLVTIITDVLTYVCNAVVQTVCGAVCGVVCGICDFFCGLFGCSCGCDNVCNNVCNVVTNVVCGWTYVLQAILEAITQLICSYILQALLSILNVIEAIVTMVLMWICTLIDIVIRWFFCWIYIADIFDSTAQRRFRVAPKLVRNALGYSNWFIYVNNPKDGTVDQKAQGYILSDQGRPLTPVADPDTGVIGYYEVETDGDFITGRLRSGPDGGYVPGQPCLYYPYKVLEIASHLFDDIFASGASDNGRGTDYGSNLFTYNANVQAWLDGDSKLAGNNYNWWSDKYDTSKKSSSNYFGDKTISDMGTRVDTDSTCNHPTNAFLNLVNGGIDFTAPSSSVADQMTCDASELLSLDQQNFLLTNEEDGSSVTTYFVSKYDNNDSSVGCNQWLGFTIVTFQGSSGPLFVANKVLAFSANTNRMMATIVENLTAKNPAIVRVAETYLHESGHQCGLLHDKDAPGCENDTTLHISKVMNPDGSIRRAYTRLQWCMVRTSPYMTTDPLPPFTQAPELPDSGTTPPKPPR